MTDLSVVVVTYHSREVVGPALESIAAQTPGGAPAETIVVDNGSADGTAAWITQAFPWVRVIENPSNAGFAKAANQGLRMAAGEYVLFLNPDARLGAGALGGLMRTLERDSRIGLVGPRLLGGAAPGWGEFPTLLGLLRRRVEPAGSRAVREPGAGGVDWLLGACLLGKSKLLHELSGFDEDYFLYGEDMDLCDRVRAAGFEVVYDPDVEVEHIGNDRWSSERLARVHAAILLFFRKRRSLPAFLAARAGLCALRWSRAVTGSFAP